MWARARQGHHAGHDLRGRREEEGDYTEYDSYTQGMAGEITQATATTLAVSLAATLSDGKKIS
jgi:hypothetical protein